MKINLNRSLDVWNCFNSNPSRFSIIRNADQNFFNLKVAAIAFTIIGLAIALFKLFSNYQKKSNPVSAAKKSKTTSLSFSTLTIKSKAPSKGKSKQSSEVYGTHMVKSSSQSKKENSSQVLKDWDPAAFSKLFKTSSSGIIEYATTLSKGQNILKETDVDIITKSINTSLLTGAKLEKELKKQIHLLLKNNKEDIASALLEKVEESYITSLKLQNHSFQDDKSTNLIHVPRSNDLRSFKSQTQLLKREFPKILIEKIFLRISNILLKKLIKLSNSSAKVNLKLGSSLRHYPTEVNNIAADLHPFLKKLDKTTREHLLVTTTKICANEGTSANLAFDCLAKMGYLDTILPLATKKHPDIFVEALMHNYKNVVEDENAITSKIDEFASGITLHLLSFYEHSNQGSNSSESENEVIDKSPSSKNYLKEFMDRLQSKKVKEMAYEIIKKDAGKAAYIQYTNQLKKDFKKIEEAMSKV